MAEQLDPRAAAEERRIGDRLVRAVARLPVKVRTKLLIAFVGVTLGMVAGMPTMVRSRFSTPTIGRDWMIGELGSARTDIDPDGVITLRDAPWRARTNRATPIRRDEPARVVAIEGLVLEVEPEEGGARDYRERARSGE